MVCAPNAKKQTHAHGMYWDCREFELAGSPGGDVWRWGAALSEAGAVAALEEAAVGLVTGLLPMATRRGSRSPAWNIAAADRWQVRLPK